MSKYCFTWDKSPLLAKDWTSLKVVKENWFTVSRLLREDSWLIDLIEL